MAKKPDTQVVSRAEARGFALKANEFLGSAETAIEAAAWNAAGLAAIHAGIAAADAVLVAVAGLRSVSQDHGYVIRLLEDNVVNFPAPQRRHITGLLHMKNAVAYENRLLTETEARQLFDHANRFVRWAQRTVVEHA